MDTNMNYNKIANVFNEDLNVSKVEGACTD